MFCITNDWNPAHFIYQGCKRIANLPRIDVILEPEVDVSGMKKMGEEITEELDLKPASLFVMGCSLYQTLLTNRINSRTWFKN